LGRPDRGGRLWPVVVVVLAMAAAVVAGGPVAAAPADQFGGFELLARGNGVQVTYDSPGLVPVGPAFQASIPEALATSSSGTNYALASLAYPGPVLADLSTVLAQSNPDVPKVVPPYPVRTQAFFPSGPPSQSQSGGSAEMRSVADAESSHASAFYSATDVGPLVQAGAIRSNSVTRVEDGKVTSRARVEVSGVDLLGGLFHADSVVTDLVAVSDGKTAASDGRTTVNGLTFLGLEATVDREGLHLVERPPDTDRPPSPLDPLLGPVLGSTTLPPGATAAVQPLLASVRDAVGGLVPDDALTDALESAGVRLRVLDPVATSDKGTATRSAYGLELALEYTASGDPVVGPLLTSLPPGSLPAECPVPGAPVDCSPEGLVSLLSRTHAGNLGIGAADVRVAATAPFEPFEATFTPSTLPAGPGADAPVVAAGVVPAAGFSTPVPDLAGGSGADGGLLPLSAFGRALPAVLVVLLLASAPLWGAASRRLADAALAEGGAGCPEGRDVPPRGGPG
jgi:hypothetical protein